MNDEAGKVLVAGAGGFIGGHLVADLLKKGRQVRAVDIKPFTEWHQIFPEAENLILDLSNLEACHRVAAGVLDIFNLAADMGGMGYIEKNKCNCMLSVLINTHLLVAARRAGIRRYFYASSACVYAAGKQNTYDASPLREEDAYPAMPEDGYGWEKLFSERMCRDFREDFGVQTRVARLHNVYGPHGTWRGGREKAPAAICRKVAEAVIYGLKEIEIWGNGEQRRSFMWIADCIHGIPLITYSNFVSPINLGSAECVSINQLVGMVEEIAGTRLIRRYVPDAPKGVKGRSSDNTLIKEVFGWEPSTPLMDGLEATYRWVYDQVKAG